MNLITGLTDSPAQTVALPIQDGSTAVLTLAFRPQQLGWYYDLVWNGQASTFQVKGRRLATFPNVLRQYRNRLPFGLWCWTQNNGEPIYVDDLASGRVRLYLLAPADVAAVEAAAFP